MYIHIYMITKLVQKFGNSAHVVLPKEYIGKRIRFIAEPKTFDDIKSQVLEILKPYLENILGIYLYGSYARNEQIIDSDVDILVITNTKSKFMVKSHARANEKPAALLSVEQSVEIARARFGSN